MRERFSRIFDGGPVLDKKFHAMQTDTMDCANAESPLSDFQYQHKNTVEMIYQILKANFEAGKSQAEILAIVADLKNDSVDAKPSRANDEMQNKLKLPALDGYTVIDGDTVSVVTDDDPAIQISAEEWKYLREHLRFDDAVDYERGETPMTGYRLRIFVELIRQRERLEGKLKSLQTP